MRIKYNYRKSFSSKIDLKINKNRKNPKKILACPKKHKKIVACPIHFCKKNDFWPVLISAPPCRRNWVKKFPISRFLTEVSSKTDFLLDGIPCNIIFWVDDFGKLSFVPAISAYSLIIGINYRGRILVFVWLV